MPPPTPHRHLPRLVAGLFAALPLLALAGCRTGEFPQSTFDTHSEYAGWLSSLTWQLIGWSVVIFVVVQGLLLFAVLRFRGRPGAPDPKPVHGNTVLEIAWTIAPAIILTFVAVPTVLTIFRTQRPPVHTDLVVKAIGHQWWWEFQYPDRGIVTADELHLPIGRTAVVQIESADVIHSFWFPAMGGKRDAIPGRTNQVWFTPDRIGEYPGQCVEFCGLSHANMRMKLMVESEAGFAAWVANQQRGPVGGGAPPDSAAAADGSGGAAAAGAGSGAGADAVVASAAGAQAMAAHELTPLARQGKEIFSQSACIGCHTIQGLSAGVLGPNLTHFAGRTSFAGAIFERTPENLARWLADPPGRKPGALMPNLGLTPEQISALVAYLQSLK